MPTKDMPRYYWDSCVFLSAIEGEPDRTPTIEQLLEECDDRKHEILTSHLSMTEVCYAKAEKSGRCLNDETEKKINKLWDADSPIKTVEVHELIAHNAKRLIRDALTKGFGLKPPDAIHLATAKVWEVAEFHTYDIKLFKFSPIMGFKIVIPHVQQLLMYPGDRSPIRVLRHTQHHWRVPTVPRPDRTDYFRGARRSRLGR